MFKLENALHCWMEASTTLENPLSNVNVNGKLLWIKPSSFGWRNIKNISAWSKTINSKHILSGMNISVREYYCAKWKNEKSLMTKIRIFSNLIENPLEICIFNVAKHNFIAEVHW